MDDDGEFLASKKAVIHRSVTFHVPTGLPGNLIDFDDGLGYRSLSNLSGESIQIDYENNFGLKTIRISDAMRTVAGLELQVKEPTKMQNGNHFTYTPPDLILTMRLEEDYEPQCAGSYPDSDDSHPLSRYSETRGGKAKAYIRYASGRSQLERPLLLVEGIDFVYDQVSDESIGSNVDDSGDQIIRYGSNGWDVVMQGIDERKFPQGEPDVFADIPIAFEEARQDGYDVIYLDFEDGTDYIEKNVLLFQDCIRQINELKVGNASNVVIGVSMGGLITRVGLAELEREGYDHCTRVWGTFDSPHQGANIPLSIQSFAWFNANIYHFDNDPGTRGLETAQSAWYKLNRPAARQLTYFNFGDMVKKEELDARLRKKEFLQGNDWNDVDINEFLEDWDFGCLRSSFVSKLKMLGVPKHSWNMAIANGTGEGLDLLPYAPGECLIKAHIDALEDDKFKAHIYALDGSEDQIIGEFEKPTDGTWLGSHDYYDLTVRTNTEMPLYDNAPTSTRDDINLELVPGLLEASGDMEISCRQKFAGFIPTISTLDISNQDGSEVDLFEDLVTSRPVRNGRTSFNSIYFEPGDNTPHSQVNAGNRAFMWSQLAALTEQLENETQLPNPRGSWYNYGYQRKRLSPLAIKSGGMLSINAAGPSSYRNETNADQKEYTVYLNTGCKAGQLDIQSGGELRLGEGSSISGTLHVTAGSELRVRRNGKLKLYANSKVIVEPGGKLILDHGARIELKHVNSEIIIEGDATIEMGGTIYLRGPGQMVFDRKVNQSHPTVKLTRNLYLRSSNKNSKLLELRNTHLDMGNRSWTMRYGTVSYSGHSHIDAGSASANLRDLILNGNNSSTAVIGSSLSGKLFVLNSDFTGFEVGVDMSGSSSTSAIPLDIGGSRFDGNRISVWVKEIRSVRISGSEFTPGEYAGIGICANSVNSLTLSNCEITDYPKSEVSLSIPGAVSLGDVKTCSVTGGNYQNNHLAFGADLGTNIIFRFGTQLSNNNTAVWMNGDFVDGLVSMNCVSMINNDVGVEGLDVLLDIDAYHHAQATDDRIRPNQLFTSSQNRLFNICYAERDISLISARGNDWGVSGPNNNWHLFKSLSSASGCASRFNQIPIDQSLARSYDPACNGDGGIVIGGLTNNDGCDKIESSSMPNVGGAFMMAYDQLLHGSLDQSRQTFAQISKLTASLNSTTDDYCQHLVDVSRSFSDGRGLRHRSERDLWAGRYKESIISPNPTTGIIYLKPSDTPPNSVKIYSSSGLVDEINWIASSSNSIDLSDKKPGLYVIELVYTERQSELVKLIIQ